MFLPLFSLCIVFCPQPPVQAIHSSATATCVLTTPWCAMEFRTVSTHGMKTTAKVIFLFLPTFTKYYGWIGFISAGFRRLGLLFVLFILYHSFFPVLTLFFLQRSDLRVFFIRSLRLTAPSSVSRQASCWFFLSSPSWSRWSSRGKR